MAKKVQHGGKRPGAGRKLANPEEGRAITIAASVPEGLMDRLNSYAEAKGMSRSMAVTEAIRGLLERKKLK